MQVEVIRRRRVTEVEHFLIVVPESVDPDDLGDDDLAEIALSHEPFQTEYEVGDDADDEFEVAAL